MSICMPAFNAGKYIIEAVNSIISQTYTNWELIIVNDGSTDNTATELNKITDSRVKVYHQNNKGQCAAANRAFELSAGELIKFMDADDMISPNHLSEQVKVLHHSKNVIVRAQWGRFYKDDVTTFNLVTESPISGTKPFEWLVAAMTDKEIMLQCALWLIPREVLTKSGGWNEELSLINDFEFFIRVLLHADEIRSANDAIVYYRSSIAGSLSATNTLEGAWSAYQSVNQGVQYLLNKEDSERTKKVAADCFQRLVYTFYPLHKQVVLKAEQKVKELGGSDVSFPSGGYTKILSRFMGWKNTKKLKSAIKKNNG